MLTAPDVGMKAMPARITRRQSRARARETCATMPEKSHRTRYKPRKARKPIKCPRKDKKKPFNFGKIVTEKYPLYSSSLTPCLGRQI
jgi:hypothetical protein